MLTELVAVVQFDDSGAFLERPIATASSSLPSSVDNSLSAHHGLGSSNGSSSHDSAAPPPPPVVRLASPPRGPPSFESFLAVPRGFLAQHALHSATEATLLLDVARLAVEMDAVVECALEQLQDRAQLSSALAAGDAQTASTGASLATTLLVLIHQAAAANTHTLTTLVERLQSCVHQLTQMRYPLAQCIESNHLSARDLAQWNPSLAQSRMALAEVEVMLLNRLNGLQQSSPSFRMTPLTVPDVRPADPSDWGTPQRSWPPSSFLGTSPSRVIDDVRLSSSASSAASSGLESLSSSTPRSAFQLSTTPLCHAVEEPQPREAGSSSSSTTTNGSASSRPNGSSSTPRCHSSSDSNRQHSQPQL